MKKGLMQEKLVRVPIEAKFSERVYKDIPAKEAFYTAGYSEGSTERYLGPMNHSETYVLDGSALGIPHDVLLRTGNGLIGLQPEARAIIDSKEESGFRVYRTRELPAENERELLSKLGLFEIYEMFSAIGPEPHNKRMRTLLKELGRSQEDK